MIKMKKEKNLNDYVYIAVLITVLVLIVFYIIYVAIGKPPIFNCWIYDKFGIYCPGCGCTRAVIYLFQGDIIKSLYYNPTVLYSVIVLIIYITSNTIAKLSGKKNSKFSNSKFNLKYTPILIYIGIFILITTCIVKNVLKFIRI